jgi:hypothetical protein
MKLLLQIAFVLGFLSLATACSRSEQPSTTAPAATQAPPPATQPAKPTAEERIAAIEASGRTGFWASVSDVCRQEIGRGVRTTLAWNVKGRADHVVLFVNDPIHGEQHFGQGGPIGEKETGPWLKPGLAFLLRSSAGEELGRVEITEKPAEACSH